MLVLITGAGLIGCYTAKDLMKRGHDVTFFDLQPNQPYLQKVLRCFLTCADWTFRAEAVPEISGRTRDKSGNLRV